MKFNPLMRMRLLKLKRAKPPKSQRESPPLPRVRSLWKCLPRKFRQIKGLQEKLSRNRSLQRNSKNNKSKKIKHRPRFLRQSKRKARSSPQSHQKQFKMSVQELLEGQPRQVLKRG